MQDAEQCDATRQDAKQLSGTLVSVGSAMALWEDQHAHPPGVHRMEVIREPHTLTSNY